MGRIEHTMWQPFWRGNCKFFGGRGGIPPPPPKETAGINTGRETGDAWVEVAGGQATALPRRR